MYQSVKKSHSRLRVGDRVELFTGKLLAYIFIRGKENRNRIISEYHNNALSRVAR
ncbi:MAG: hypothetical protein Q4F15_00740 [Bacillota bacterium]|nr:hypothetical protein [Bacillota bacterium]